MNHPVDIHVGQKIKQRREEIPMTASKLGERLGISFQQVSKYEKASNRVSASRLVDIAHVLDVEPAYFFEGLEYKPMVDISSPNL